MQVSDLLEKSQANKALHDKQRKATSYANFETSRQVSGNIQHQQAFFYSANRVHNLYEAKVLSNVPW